MRKVILATGMILMGGVAACSGIGGKDTKQVKEDNVYGRPVGSDQTGSLLEYVFGDDEKKTDGNSFLGVNKYLWRASLETLAFLPLASSDPYGGVIVSDWGTTSDNPNERFKVTTYILSEELTADALKVNVFRQTKTLSGDWVEAPVQPKTAEDLEDAILTKARQNRIAALEE